MTIAPNQDFVLATVPRQEAGTASGILGTAQRLGTSIGIALIGTVLFGSLHVAPGPRPSPGPSATARSSRCWPTSP